MLNPETNTEKGWYLFLNNMDDYLQTQTHL